MEQLKLPFKPMGLRGKAIELLKLSIECGHPNFEYDEDHIAHFLWYLKNNYEIVIDPRDGIINPLWRSPE